MSEQHELVGKTLVFGSFDATIATPGAPFRLERDDGTTISGEIINVDTEANTVTARVDKVEDRPRMRAT